MAYLYYVIIAVEEVVFIEAIDAEVVDEGGAAVEEVVVQESSGRKMVYAVVVEGRGSGSNDIS